MTIPAGNDAANVNRRGDDGKTRLGAKGRLRRFEADLMRLTSPDFRMSLEGEPPALRTPTLPPSSALPLARPKPAPCATLIVVGVVVALVGTIIGSVGIQTYFDTLLYLGEPSGAGIVVGGIVSLIGMIVTLVGIYRAAAALDYLVDRSL
ncbi:hypothetical protein [Georgenia sp. AZ-5]|uniref:hypothetical protein n=1 Tax=Georgenia sp. AZ-5 TaxID=3367526 RepID=UPI0037551A77